MQERALSHSANSVRNLLNALPGGWIGRYGSIERASRSPDLSLTDFFLWSAMKDPVYNSKRHSLDDLKLAIGMQFNAINSYKE